MAIIDIKPPFPGGDADDVLKFVPALIVIGMLLLASITMFYKVGAEEVALVTRFGKVVREEGEGLHFKMPFGIERANLVPIQRVFKQEFGYRTMQGGVRTQYANRNFNEESLMLTGDLNVADIEWVVQYQISDAYDFLFNVRNPEETLRDISEACMRLVVGDRSMDSVLTVGRAQIQDDVEKLTNTLMKEYRTGLRVIGVQMQNVNPPEEVSPSFNEVNQARQDKERMINEAWQAYNNEIPKASGQKQKMISEAEGYAQERINQAEGEAKRFLSILEEYRKAPAVTRKRLYLESMSDVLARSKQKYVVDEKVRSILPMLQIDAAGKEAAR